MNMQIICLLAVLFINLLIAVAIVISLILLNKSIENDRKLKEDMFLFSLPINSEDNFMILDNLIKEEIDVYTIYNFPAYSDELYVSEDDMNKMIKVILSQVLKKLSPVYMNKLKYIYNEDIFEDIVFAKVRDAVLNFSIEINGSYSDVKKNNPVGQ